MTLLRAREKGGREGEGTSGERKERHGERGEWKVHLTNKWTRPRAGEFSYKSFQPS